jgi:phenylacetate-coenzyme A ligase PaaK-like adenylate-forming protein
VGSVSNWNGWMLVSIMQQHRLQTQFLRVYKQSPFLRVMFDSEGIHQAVHVVAEHKVIFLSEKKKKASADDFETKKFGYFSQEDSIV